ncbi:MAG: HPr family phosphocarrier protein [Mycobacteriales bacterium]
MPERQVTAGPGVGLHARPAALFVKAASKAAAEVSIAKPGAAPVSAKSILAVLGLDVRGGDEVVLSVEGDGAAETLDELAAMIAAGDGDG